MIDMMIYIAVAVLVTALLMSLLWSLRRIKRLEDNAISIEDRLHEQITINDSYRDNESLYREEISCLKSENFNLQRSYQEFKESSLKNEQHLKESFENIATKVLEQRRENMEREGSERIKRTLEPLQLELSNFKSHIDKLYSEEGKDKASLKSELRQLITLNKQLSQETDSLSRTIRGEYNPKQQGDWGEMILETILSNSGLERDVHYFTQQSTTDEDGNRKRPDVVVRYPDGREIIIDSKVSLTSYARYVAAIGDEQREHAMQQHITAVKRHIDSLSSKRYGEKDSTLDFVMMFMPVEPAYMLALGSDSSLWEYAYKKKIILVSPTHLITALKLVYDLWSRDAQNKNAIDIAQRGAQMYDKFVGFMADMQSINKSLEGATKSYNQAMNKLTSGRGNLVGQAQKLKDLGVRASKELNIASFEQLDE